MKIDPVSEFIKNTVSSFGEVIVVLGSRIEESATRAQVIRKHQKEGSDLLDTLPYQVLLYTLPIADWTADDAWEVLLTSDTPWETSIDDSSNYTKDPMTVNVLS